MSVGYWWNVLTENPMYTERNFYHCNCVLGPRWWEAKN